MSDKYVILYTNEFYEGVVYDSFGQEPFLGSYDAATHLLKEMNGGDFATRLNQPVIYKMYKLVEENQ